MVRTCMPVFSQLDVLTVCSKRTPVVKVIYFRRKVKVLCVNCSELVLIIAFKHKNHYLPANAMHNNH